MNGATQLEVIYDWRDRRLAQRLLARGETLTFGTGPQATLVAPEPHPDPRTPEPRAETSEPADTEAKTEARPANARAPKAKVYTFSGLDVEGKLKTPQLLYFLNRVKSELDTTGHERRSFLKELEQSSDDKGL